MGFGDEHLRVRNATVQLEKTDPTALKKTTSSVVCFLPKTMNPLTLWRCDVRVVQRVHDAGVIFTKRQVFYQMGHVYLQGRQTGRLQGDRLLQLH